MAPRGVCVTSGWNWIPYQGFEECATAAKGDEEVIPIVMKSLGGVRSLSPCDIHTWNSSGREENSASTAGLEL